MKRVLAVVLMVIGVVVAGFGAAGMVMVKGGDVLWTPEKALDLGAAKAVVSTPGTLAWRETTLLVSARSDAGPVFLGAGHPVDTASFLAGAPVVAVTQVGVGGVTGEPVAGDGKAVPADPSKGSFWTARANGPGAQEIRLSLTGAPVEWMAVPAKPGPVHLRIGVVVRGARSVAIGLLVGGVAALVGGIWLLRRSRRRPPGPAVVDGSGVGQGALPAGGPVQAPGATSTALRGVLVLGLAAGLAGCASLPQKAPAWKDVGLTKAALTASEIGPALADYDRRNNAAIAATSKPPYDWNGWKVADGESLLDVDRFATAYAKATKAKPDTTKLTHKGEVAYTGEFAAYPMSAFVTATSTSSASTDKPDPTTVSFMALSRGSAMAPWIQVGVVTVARSVLPKPAESPGAATPTAAQAKAARAAAEDLRASVARRAPGKVGWDKNLREFFVKDTRQGVASHASSAEIYRMTLDPAAADGDVRSVVTAKGVLTLVPLRVTDVLVGKPGTQWYFESPYDVLFGQTGMRETLSYRYTVTALVLIEASGQARVLGSEASDIQ